MEQFTQFPSPIAVFGRAIFALCLFAFASLSSGQKQSGLSVCPEPAVDSAVSHQPRLVRQGAAEAVVEGRGDGDEDQGGAEGAGADQGGSEAKPEAARRRRILPLLPRLPAALHRHTGVVSTLHEASARQNTH